MDATPFECDKLIRFHHCDPAGIVFYPQYFVLFNELVEDWFNQGLGIDFARLHVEEQRGIPMGHIECRFLAPSKVGDKLHLSLAVQHLGHSSLQLRVSASLGDEIRVRATLTLVHASLTTRRALPLPDDMRAQLERYLLPAPE